MSNSIPALFICCFIHRSRSDCTVQGKVIESQCSFASLMVKDVGHFIVYLLATWPAGGRDLWHTLPLRGSRAGACAACSVARQPFWVASLCMPAVPWQSVTSDALSVFLWNGVYPVLPQLICQLLIIPRSQSTVFYFMPVLSILMQEHEMFSHLLGILKNFLFRGILVYRDEDLYVFY